MNPFEFSDRYEGLPLKNGLVFDIKEFSVHDGPGIRTTVFMKGCPLTCMWCHNPEGQSGQTQLMCGPAGNRIAGTQYRSADLAALLNRYAVIFKMNEGGVTFSGGEPLIQAEFIAEVIDQLNKIHVLLDTSGQGPKEDLLLLLKRIDMVYYDLKLIDREKHLRYTGVTNDVILNNLELLSSSGVDFVIRVPLVPGVTDTDQNLADIANLVKGLPGMLQVDLLPYNRAAGAKYEAAGKSFLPDYDENLPVNANVAIFEKVGIKVCVT